MADMETSGESGALLDRWADWLLNRRFGGNRKLFEVSMSRLATVRDRIIGSAGINPGDTVLDIGTGDGLLAFTALEKAGRSGQVIFSDISADAIESCRTIAGDAVTGGTARFVVNSADNLHDISSRSVDVVIGRAVLSYIPDKGACFREFARILRPGGRISLCEPINRFIQDHREPTSFLGYDLSPLGEIGERVVRRYRAMQKTGPDGIDPMTNFDDRDLFRAAYEAGFSPVNLEFAASISHKGRFVSWEALYRSAPNPNAPTLEEVVLDVLDESEAASFKDYFRALIETGYARHVYAEAYITASRSS